MKGGTKVLVEKHRHEGIFVARGKEDALVTLNSTPGVAVYGEKRISVEVPPAPGDETGVPHKVEYRVWNPFRSKRTFDIVSDLSLLELHISEWVLIKLIIFSSFPLVHLSHLNS